LVLSSRLFAHYNVFGNHCHNSMKLLSLFCLLFCLWSAPTLAQSNRLVRFLNYAPGTQLQQYTDYTVRYTLNPDLEKEAYYLFFNQQAGGSRYHIPFYNCQFPNCAKEFTFFVNASVGQQLQFWAQSWLTAARGIVDSSGYAVVVPRRTSIRSNVDSNGNEILRISPNPADTYVTVRFQQEAGTTITVFIVSAIGHEIYRYTSRSQGEQWIGFDTKALPEGAYFLRLEAANTSSSAKFIIRH
jgi:hypothetical protein